MQKLHMGKIDYLNIHPVFVYLENCSIHKKIEYTLGHPSFLNEQLRIGKLDISPSSVFEYLAQAEQYLILPNAGISANYQVKSVLFASPVPLEEIGTWMVKNDNTIYLTDASATSVALFKIIWILFWKFPIPNWKIQPVGTGGRNNIPFVEIGNYALQRYYYPENFIIYDLAQIWRKFTGLPFVFALWILRREVAHTQNSLLLELVKNLSDINSIIHKNGLEIAENTMRPEWLSAESLSDYWQTLEYGLGDEHLAAIILYARYCSELKLIEGVPSLCWFK